MGAYLADVLKFCASLRVKGKVVVLNFRPFSMGSGVEWQKTLGGVARTHHQPSPSPGQRSRLDSSVRK